MLCVGVFCDIRCSVGGSKRCGRFVIIIIIIICSGAHTHKAPVRRVRVWARGAGALGEAVHVCGLRPALYCCQPPSKASDDTRSSGVRARTGVRRLQCGICGRTYSGPNKLSAHMRGHVRNTRAVEQRYSACSVRGKRILEGGCRLVCCVCIGRCVWCCCGKQLKPKSLKDHRKNL